MEKLLGKGSSQIAIFHDQRGKYKSPLLLEAEDLSSLRSVALFLISHY